MKDRKNIVLLIIAIIIFCIAIVFAIYSFKIDKVVAEDQIPQNNIQISDNNNNSNNDIQEFSNEVLNEVSKTKDFEATYTDFVVEDEQGNEIKLSDYQGEPVMVLFWSAENEDSLEMLKRVNEQYESYKDRINFIAIHTKEEEVELSDINLPIYTDKEQEVSSLYSVTEVPTMLYINKENEIFNSKTGLTTREALKANLDILIENF